MNACRMEKGYRHWGHDIGSEDTPLEAGLGFAVAWDKPGGFIGREALLSASAVEPPHPTLGGAAPAGDAPLLYHDEPIWADGRIVGARRAACGGTGSRRRWAWGICKHEDGVTQAWLDGLALEVEVAWERVPAKARIAPWYDPRNERIRQ